uniref:Uncharacterized protein n=1 Tax=Ananas comosus var. bracteatus TaxID=296719 RepID=A0A6V7NU53_ANACO|nr:unnamed protein product [Ananas comosus var. bracteatus]
MVTVKEETRKGPWTEQEDLQLVCFVRLFGERRWDFIAKVSGLNRTGRVAASGGSTTSTRGSSAAASPSTKSASSSNSTRDGATDSEDDEKKLSSSCKRINSMKKLIIVLHIELNDASK